MKDWTFRPRFSIVLHASSLFSEDEKQRSIQSVTEQIYPSWIISEEPTNTVGDGIASIAGTYVVPLRVGDRLSASALFRFAQALQSSTNAEILYGDHDYLDKRGRRRSPWFKPRWNQEMFLAQDYLSPATAIESRLAWKAAESSDDLAALLLTATSATKEPIVHVPHILCHVSPRSDDQSSHRRVQAVARHVGRFAATCRLGAFGAIKVVWPLPTPLPLVTVIIPTRDKIELLRPCVESVLRHRNYDNFEILIVDNASTEVRAIEYLREIGRNPKVRVISFPASYNFSAINNYAVGLARGSYLCLLNNDTEVLEPAWLSEMMRYAVRPEIGAVGAKLLYEDGTIQHAGVVLGIGDAAGHAHRFLPADQPGYFNYAHVPQFVSAVTAACLVVDKEKYLTVGGLDEKDLPVAFNDVDFCMKLEGAGWLNVYVPYAVLVHHESKSRGKDISPQNIDRYRRELGVLQKRWRTKTYEDPLHNPNLDRYSETFVCRI